VYIVLSVGIDSEGSNVKKNHAGSQLWLLSIVVASVLLFSCSGRVDQPSEAIERMVRAYGGPEKVKALENYIGRGFRKDLFNPNVAVSYPFDIYRKGEKYKTRTSFVTKGELVDAVYTFHTMEYNYAYSKADRKRDFQRWDMGLLEYRFPLVLGWAQGDDLQGTLVDDGSKDGICRIMYEDQFNYIQLGIDSKTWLLDNVRIQDKKDSVSVFSERYSDYTPIDGVPFPARTKSTHRGQGFYEYYLVKIEFGIELPDSIFEISPGEIEEINNIKDTRPQ
jgi:hypothetical protein